MGSFVRILEDYDVFLQAVEEEEDYDHQEKWRDITIIFCGNFLVLVFFICGLIFVVFDDDHNVETPTLTKKKVHR